MATKPGSQSNYSNGDAHLLSAIIQRATGEDSLEFGWKHLFQPLEMPRPKWFRDPQGINVGSATVAIASPVSIAYRTAKMGVVGFTRALAATLGDEGITINVVLPSRHGDLLTTDD